MEKSKVAEVSQKSFTDLDIKASIIKKYSGKGGLIVPLNFLERIKERANLLLVLRHRKTCCLLDPEKIFRYGAVCGVVKGKYLVVFKIRECLA